MTMDSGDTRELMMQSDQVKSEPVACDEPASVANLVSSPCRGDVLTGQGGPETSDAGNSDDLKDDFDAFCRFAFPTDDDKSGPDVFYFESDHVALKGNEDYQRLLRAFVMLVGQRTAAIRDLDALLELQQKALLDPMQFVGKLQHGRLDTELPGARPPVELPTIPWDRYTEDVEGVLASLGGSGHTTRLKQKRELMNGIRDPVYYPPSTSTSSTSASERPSTFNQPWSVEEQRQLEHLLEKYPSERFEARRFAKIAAELPGRTTQQVTSRVQKYFIKLAKAGLPVPGRMPNLAAYGGRWFSGRFHGHHHRNNHFYFPQSTFLASYAPPVYMAENDLDDDDDDDDVVGRIGHGSTSKTMCDDDDDIPECLRDTDEYRELKTLTALRQSRLSGAQCRLTGQCGHSTDGHSALTSHRGGVESTEKPHIDLDYTSESTGVSSYLDPNYMPAV